MKNNSGKKKADTKTGSQQRNKQTSQRNKQSRSGSMSMSNGSSRTSHSK